MTEISSTMEAEDTAALYFRMFTEINIIGHLSINELERVLPEGLSSAGFGVLNHFARVAGPSAPARLARAFQVSKGAMTNTLQRLEAQGLIEIRPDPRDARAKLVQITEAGRRIQRMAVRASGEIMGDLVKQIPVAEVRAVLPFLQHVREVMDARRDPPGTAAFP